ncbi:hypothetical protein RUMTOR_00004 [[Ruminococcus] torques ATCC 27756]|uniref:Uncharacterized protein n=1 Tax=[Ruminococcus] torques ATCC 27756 TaxID=411460 RepID=A5KIF9_9FIRM|nr:hypothetical protein RUMTOR_00004 [[Ruminococcus] torques ATCC 27756]
MCLLVLSAIILVRRVKCGKHTVTERKKEEYMMIASK